MSGSEKKVNENTYDISSKNRVTKICFWKFHVVVVQNNGKEMYKKSVLHGQSCFLLMRPIVVFSPFSLPSPLSITRFYILFKQTLNIIESFAFSPGEIYILLKTIMANYGWKWSLLLFWDAAVTIDVLTESNKGAFIIYLEGGLWWFPYFFLSFFWSPPW